MEINGRTLPLAVLGHPVAHTLSPPMHNGAIAALGLNAAYTAYDVEPTRLMEVLRAMQGMGFGGVNLTVPLKEVAFRGVDELAESARLLGSVNTIEFLPDGSLRGHSTDGEGFLRDFKEVFGNGVEDRHVCVLGPGGAGRAVAIATAMAGAASLTIAGRNAAKTAALADELVALDRCRVETVVGGREEWTPVVRESQIIIQATTIGMQADDPLLLDRAAFCSGQQLYDLIYVYPQTAIMQEAEAAGAVSANGLGMLLHQGALSFEIWTGTAPPLEPMRAALEQCVYRTGVSNS